jgi:hypothetical protein
MILALAGGVLLATTLATAPADVTGKWGGTLVGQGSDGSTREDAALLILTQKENTITGTIGGSETDQHKITKGTIDGDKVVVTAVTPNGREIQLDLVVENDEMKGTITAGERKGQVLVKRLKQ